MNRIEAAEYLASQAAMRTVTQEPNNMTVAMMICADAARTLDAAEEWLEKTIKLTEMELDGEYSLEWENAAGRQYTARQLMDFIAIRKEDA